MLYAIYNHAFKLRHLKCRPDGTHLTLSYIYTHSTLSRDIYVHDIIYAITKSRKRGEISRFSKHDGTQCHESCSLMSTASECTCMCSKHSDDP
jgi:hypothetical protein